MKYEIEPYYITNGLGVGIYLKDHVSWISNNDLLVRSVDLNYSIFKGYLREYNGYTSIRVNKLCYKLYIEELIKFAGPKYWDYYI
jgi:hypothetical protein